MKHCLGFLVSLLFTGSTFSQSGSRDLISVLPPGSPVRTMAEWEESQGYLITWTSYPQMLREIVRHGKQQCRMYVVTDNPNSVMTDLNNNSIDTTNVTFLNYPFNTVWSRDYGQWCVYTNSVDSLLFIDWLYNRNRPKDDSISQQLGAHLGLPVYKTSTAPFDLINTGGNLMVDGQGTAFASNLILDENDGSGSYPIYYPTHTEAEIDNIMNLFMGINRYIKMETLPYDGIHHIDMHMKLLDEETLLVGEYPSGVADGPQIEANIQYVLSNYQSCFGTPYRVIRIPMPDDGGAWPSGFGDYLTYTNSSFINKTIIVPTYNIPSDTTALRIYRENLPGYNVVGINSTYSIGASGALHCITKEIGTNDPLLIVHQRLTDTYNTTNPYIVSAKAFHRSGIQNITLHYTTDTTQPYQSIAMFDVFGDHYEGNIPAQPVGTEVFYYISAVSNTGKTQVRPIVAPDGFYNFKVLAPNAVVEENAVPEMSVYPNPANAITCVELQFPMNETLQLDLYDIAGRFVQSIANENVANGTHRYFIQAEKLPRGFYTVRAQTSHGENSHKLVVK